MNTSSPLPFVIRPATTRSRLRGLVPLAILVVAALGLAGLLNSFVFQSFYVDGESMSPTLHTDDRVIISKVERTIALATGSEYIPVRGQIAIINGEASPKTLFRAAELIKRIAAVPGDTINISGGNVTITTETGDSFSFDQKYGLNLGPTYSDKDIEILVPSGKVFVLGDNRANGGSHDSRAFGLVDNRHLEGRLVAIIMPFEKRRVF